MKSDPNVTGGKVFLWLLVALGAWMIWSGFGEIGKNPRAHWVSVIGKVINVEQVEPLTDITGQNFTGPRGYDIYVTYSFTPDGGYYEGVWSYHDPSQLPEIRYNVNKQVMVFYDPKHPGNSSLEDGSNLVVTRNMKRADIFSGSVMLITGLFFLAMLEYKSAKQGAK